MCDNRSILDAAHKRPFARFKPDCTRLSKIFPLVMTAAAVNFFTWIRTLQRINPFGAIFFRTSLFCNHLESFASQTYL
jgi:hypothetical protein